MDGQLMFLKMQENPIDTRKSANGAGTIDYL